MSDELERQYARTKGSRSSKDRGSGGSTGSARSSRSTHKSSSFKSSYSERSSRSSSRPHSPSRSNPAVSYSLPNSPPNPRRSIVDVFALPHSSSLSTHPQSPLKSPSSPFVRTQVVASSSSSRLSSSAALVLLLVGVGLTMLLFSSLSLPSAHSSPAPTAPAGMRSAGVLDQQLDAPKIVLQRSGPLQRLKDAQQRSASESPLPQPPLPQPPLPEEAGWNPGVEDLGGAEHGMDNPPVAAPADDLTPMAQLEQTQQFGEQLPLQQEQPPQQQEQPQQQQQQQPVAGFDLPQPDQDSPVLTPLPRSVGGLASAGFIFDSSFSFVLLAPAPLAPSVRVLAATWARLVARPLTIFSDAPDDELASFVVVLQDPHPERARWTGSDEVDEQPQQSDPPSLPVEDTNNDSGQRDVIWMLPQVIAHLAAAAVPTAAAAGAFAEPPAFYFLLTDSRIFPLLDALHSKLTAYRSVNAALPSFVAAGSETSIARESYWSEDDPRVTQLYPPASTNSHLTTVVPGLVGFSASFLTDKLAPAAADPQCPLLAPESLALGGLVACAGGFPADSALSLLRLSSSSPWALQFNAATTSLSQWRAQGDAFRLGGDSSEESEEAFRAYYETSEAASSELQLQMQAQ